MTTALLILLYLWLSIEIALAFGKVASMNDDGE